METADMKQKCLDLSTAAMALFDLIEAEGIDAPMDKIENILTLANVIEVGSEIKQYYAQRNIQRMLALGVSPAALLRLAEGK